MTTKPHRSKCRTIRDRQGGRREFVIGHPHRLEQTGNEGKDAGQGSADGGRRCEPSTARRTLRKPQWCGDGFPLAVLLQVLASASASNAS